MKRWLTLAALALFTFVGVEVYRAGLHETPPPPSTTQIVFRKGFASGHRIATPSWSADYDRVVSNADQTVLDLDGVKNGVIYKAGKPYLHLRVAHLSVNMLSHDFSANGALHVETVRGSPPRSFDTMSASWNDGVQRLTLPNRVSVHSGSGAPLSIGSLTFDVKRGDVELHDVAGPIRFK